MMRVLEPTERQEVRDALLADVRGSIADQFAARYTGRRKGSGGGDRRAADRAQLDLRRRGDEVGARCRRRCGGADHLLGAQGRDRGAGRRAHRRRGARRSSTQLRPARSASPTLLAPAAGSCSPRSPSRCCCRGSGASGRDFWHRNSALLLIALLTIVTVAAFKATGDRSVLPYFVPAAAVGLLLTVLLDSGVAILVMGILAIVGGAIVGSLDFATYVFLGSMAGIIDHSARRAGEQLRSGGHRHGRRQHHRRVGLRAARRARHHRTGAAARRGPAGRGGIGRGCLRHLRLPGQHFRHHHLVPAARAGQPVAAAAAPAAARDAGHVPPLADGGQPRRAGGRRDRRGSAADPRRGLLPRHRQAQQPAGLHREPGRHGEHPRRADAGAVGRGAAGARVGAASTSPTSTSCPRRSSRSSRSTTARR